MDFDKKEFYGIVAKAKKQMQITIDQDCNVADTKPDVEKMIQTRGIVKIQETEMMVDRVRIKGEFVFQGLYGTNDTSACLESLEYSLPFEEYVHIEGVLPSDYVKVKYTIDDINTILINSRKISIRVLLTFSFQITEEMKEKGIIEIHEENVSVLKKDVQITDMQEWEKRKLHVENSEACSKQEVINRASGLLRLTADMHTDRSGHAPVYADGCMAGNVYGSYVHGIFDAGDLAYRIAETLAERKGRSLRADATDYAAFKEEQYDKLAETMREYLDMDAVYGMLREAKL